MLLMPDPAARSRSRRNAVDAALAVAIVVYSSANLAFGGFISRVLPVDYLIVCLGVFALAVIMRLPRMLESPVPIMAGMAVGALALPGFLAGPASAYGVEKAISFATIILLLFTAAAIQNASNVVRTCIQGWQWFSAAVLVSLLFFGEVEPSRRLTVFGLNPIGVARLAGLGMVIWIVTLLVVKGRKLVMPLRIAGVVIALILASQTGSRGPLLSCAVAVIVALVVACSCRMISLRRLLAAVVTSAGGLLFVLRDRGTDTNSTRLFSGGDSGRSGIYEGTWTIIGQHPGGIGWGSFVEYGWRWSTGPGEKVYPHNLFLEFWVEGGLIAVVGLAVLLAIVSAVAIRVCMRLRDPDALLMLAVYVYALTNAMFSSDVVGNRLLWASGALVFAVGMSMRRTATPTQPLVPRVHHVGRQGVPPASLTVVPDVEDGVLRPQ